MTIHIMNGAMYWPPKLLMAEACMLTTVMSRGRKMAYSKELQSTRLNLFNHGRVQQSSSIA